MNIPKKFNEIGLAIQSVNKEAGNTQGLSKLLSSLSIDSLSQINKSFFEIAKSGGLEELYSAANSLESAMAGLTTQQKISIITSQNLNKAQMMAALTCTGLTDAEIAQTFATSTLNTAQKSATVSTWSWKAAWDGLKVAIATNPIGFAITAITVAASIAIPVFQKLSGAKQEIIDKANEVTEAWKQQQSVIQSTGSSIEELSSIIGKYGKGVSDQGKNISLNTEEYKLYTDTVNKVAELFPQMIKGYTDEGNAILLHKDGVEELTKAYEEMKQTAQDAILIGASDVWKGFKTSTKDFNFFSETAGSQDMIRAGEKYISLLNQYVELLNSGANTKELDAFTWRLHDLTSGASGIKFTESISELLRKAGVDTKEGIGLSATYEELNKISATYRSLVSEVNAETAKIKPIVNAFLDSDFNFQKLNDDIQSSVKSLFGNFDYSFFGQFETETEMYSWIDENLIQPLKDPSTSSQMQSAIQSLINPEFDGKTAVQLDEYIKSVLSDIEKNAPKLSEKLTPEILIKLGFDIDPSTLITEANQKIYDQVAEKFNNSLKYSDTPEMQEEITKYIQKLYQVVQNNLSTEELKIVLRPDFEIDFTSGVPLKDQVQQYIDNMNTSTTSFTTLSSIVAGLTYELSLLETVEKDFGRNLDLTTKQTEELEKSLSKLKDTYPALHNLILRYNTSKTEENRLLVENEINRLSAMEAAKNESKTYEDNIRSWEELRKIQNDNTEGKKLNALQTLDLIAQYPQLASAIEETTEGYKLEDKALQDLIETTKKHTLASIEADEEAAKSKFRETAGINVENTIDNVVSKITNKEIQSVEDFFSAFENGSENAINGAEEFIITMIALAKKQEIVEQGIEEQTDSIANLNNALAKYKTATTEAEKSSWADKANSALSDLKKQAENGIITWNEYAEAVKNVGNVIDPLKALNSELDNLQSAFDDSKEAVKQYNETGEISIDLLQKILSHGDEYLQYLFDENGQLHLNKDAFYALAEAKLDDLRVTTVKNALDTITNLINEKKATDDTTDSIKTQKEQIDELNGSLEELILKQTVSGVIMNQFGEDVTSSVDNVLKNMKYQLALIDEVNGSSLGGTGNSKNTPLDKLLDTSSLIDAKIKDLKKKLDPINAEIEDLQRKLSGAQTFGDETQIQKYNDSLIDAKNREIGIYKEMNESLRSFINQNNSAVKKYNFADIELSEYGIEKYKQDIQNKITSLDNISAKTESESIKKNNDIAIQGLNERLSKFNEYVSVTQQANADIIANEKIIKDLESDIYNTKYKEKDRLSDIELERLKEVYERTSDEKALISGILDLINDENISLSQKIKLQKEYNDALANEYRQKIKDVEHEESFTPKTDYAKLSDTALEKIRLAEEEIARLKTTPDENGVLYNENSETVRAERSNILQYQSQYTENQIALLDAEYNKTSDLVLLRQKLLDLSNDLNISAIDRANILAKIEDVDLSKYKEDIESINFAESFLDEDDFNGKLEYVKEKIAAANEGIETLLSQGYEIDSKAVKELLSDIDGYKDDLTDIKRQEVDSYIALEEKKIQQHNYYNKQLEDNERQTYQNILDIIDNFYAKGSLSEEEYNDLRVEYSRKYVDAYLEAEEKKIEQHNYHNDWLEDSERQTYSRMLSALEDYHAQGLLSEQDYYDLREQYSRKYAESGRKEVDAFLETEEKKIEAKNYYNAWFEDSEIDSYRRILASLDDYHAQGLLKEKDYYELREQYMRKLYDAEENQLKKAYKGKQKAAVDAIQAEIDALEEASKAQGNHLDAINETIKALEKQKGLYDTTISAVGGVIDDEIDKLKDQKDALQAVNQEQERKIELAELEENLRRARENKVVRIYHENGEIGFRFEVDAKAIEEAEKAINDFNFKQQTDAIDEQIASWEKYKQQWNNISKEFAEEQNKLIAEQILGKDWEQLILSQRTDILRNFADNQYNLNEQLLAEAKKRAESMQNESSAMDESTRAQIEALQKLKDGWTNALDVDDSIIKYEGSLEDLIGLESDSYDERMKKLEDFIGEWNTAVSSIKDIAMAYPTTGDINAQMQSGGGSSVGKHDPLAGSPKNDNSAQKPTGSTGSMKDSDIGKYNLNGVAIDMSEEIELGKSGDATLFMNFTDYLKNKVAWENADDATKAILNGQNQAYRDALSIPSDTMTSDEARRLLDQIASGAIKYAKGTKSAVGGLSIVDDEGKELILRNPSEGRNTTLEYGDAVVPAKLTKNIFDMAENPEEWVKDNVKSDKKLSDYLTLIDPTEYYEKLGWSKELANFNATVANTPNPVATQMYDNFVKSQNALVNSINAKNDTPVIAPTIGDIHIHNPVGDVNGLAREIKNTVSTKGAQILSSNK